MSHQGPDCFKVRLSSGAPMPLQALLQLTWVSVQSTGLPVAAGSWLWHTRATGWASPTAPVLHCRLACTPSKPHVSVPAHMAKQPLEKWPAVMSAPFEQVADAVHNATCGPTPTIRDTPGSSQLSYTAAIIGACYTRRSDPDLAAAYWPSKPHAPDEAIPAVLAQPSLPGSKSSCVRNHRSFGRSEGALL